MKTNRTNRGFTLVELIVVLGVSALVSTLGTTMFFKMTTLWNETQGRVELQRLVENAFADIGNDVGNVLSQELSGVSLNGINQEYVKENLSLADDFMIVPVQSLGNLGGDKGKVMYRLSRKEGYAGLVRTVGTIRAEVPMSGAVEVISPRQADVLRLRFEYLDDDGRWDGQWERPELPEAVRVSLAVAHVSKPWIQLAAKRTFPIPVN